jgi:hypothetical protein
VLEEEEEEGGGGGGGQEREFNAIRTIAQSREHLN